MMNKTLSIINMSVICLILLAQNQSAYAKDSGCLNLDKEIAQFEKELLIKNRLLAKSKIEIEKLSPESTSKKMNELEFRSRVRKIIKPLNVVISYNDNYLLNKKFIDVFSIETGMALFGGHLKNNSLK